MSNMEMNESSRPPVEQPLQDGIQDSIASSVSPGAQLAAKREEMNWSVEQVASHLNLAPRQIAALEADNYAALPGMAIVRGFIRAYAKLLRIDPVPLLQMISKEVTSAEEAVPLRRALSSKPFIDNRSLSMGKKRYGTKFIMAGIVVIMVIGAVLLAARMEWMPKSLKTQVEANFGLLSAGDFAEKAEPAASSLETAKIQDFSAGAGSSNEMVRETLVSPAPGTSRGMVANPLSATAVSSPVLVSKTKDVSVTTSLQSESSSASGSENSTADAKDLLVLKLREDSWIEIRRPDDSIVISRLGRAGATESFKVGGTLNVTVGNAAGVDATLRGKPIRLTDRANNNVARLTLK